LQQRKRDHRLAGVELGSGDLSPGLPPSDSFTRAAITSLAFVLVWVPAPPSARRARSPRGKTCE
jgi:hypothetical protein